MRTDKQKALKLRLRGKSYNEIHELLGTPKATLSAWFGGLEISDTAQEKIREKSYQKSFANLMQRNKRQTQLAEKRARDIRIKAKREIKALSKKELFLIGTTLYWTLGYKRPVVIKGKVKTRHAVSITNSDPNVIKIFLRFLREICKVQEDKITASLRMSEHQSESYLLDFWSKIADLPPNKFQKFYYGANKANTDKKPFNILPYGTIQVRINSTELYHRIMGWIDGLALQ